jgi:hypothetical protein
MQYLENVSPKFFDGKIDIKPNSVSEVALFDPAPTRGPSAITSF